MDIERDTYKNAHDDLDEVRIYDRGDISLPSVTTILKTREDDKSNLYAWQDRNNGEGDNAYHKHLFWYKRHRGTLCHWYALKTLDPSLEWSPDEAQSMYMISNVASLNDPEKHPEVHDARPRDVLYSVLKSQNAVESWGEFYDRHPPDNSESYFEAELKAQYERDRDYFVAAFERICDKLSITSESTITVEKYLFEEQQGYAGQVDLVYEDDEGNTVVADLKTSSGCYSKHKLQGAAYGKAIERDDDIDAETVDRLEVIRIHPDSGEYAVHTHRDSATHPIHTSDYWRRDFDDLWAEFAELAGNFEYDNGD
jgi:hypothetical protein